MTRWPKRAVLGLWLVLGLGGTVYGQVDDLVVREREIALTKSAQRPLICGAVRAAQGIGAALDAALGTALPGQVPYGSTLLSRYAFHYRYMNNLLSSGRNVAVFEYLARPGLKRLIAIASDKAFTALEGDDWFPKHAEQILAKTLGPLGIDDRSVTAIYSELAPCVTGSSSCSGFLAQEFPKAVVSFSFDYGATKASRRAGVAALKLAVNSCK